MDFLKTSIPMDAFGCLALKIKETLILILVPHGKETAADFDYVFCAGFWKNKGNLDYLNESAFHWVVSDSTLFITAILAYLNHNSFQAVSQRNGRVS